MSLSSRVQRDASYDEQAEKRSLMTMITMMTLMELGFGVRKMRILKLLLLLCLLSFTGLVSTATAANSTYGKLLRQDVLRSYVQCKCIRFKIICVFLILNRVVL